MFLTRSGEECMHGNELGLVSLDAWLKQMGRTGCTGWRWRKKGWLKTVNICGRAYITQEAIAEFMERRTVEWWEHDGEAHLEKILARLHVAGRCERVELREWLSLARFEIVGSDDLAHLRAGTNVAQVRSSRGVMFYASRYIAKIEGTGPPVGRWWGVFNPRALPWARAVEVELSVAGAVR